MNWGAIRSMARVKLADPDAVQWTNAELLTYATETQDYLTTNSEANLKTLTFPLTSGTRTYTLPDDLYEIRGVRVNGSKVFGSTAFDLEDLDAQYLTTTGTPQWYYLEGTRTLAFYPISSPTATTITFTQELGEVNQWNDGTSNYSMTSELGVVYEILDDSNGTLYYFNQLLGVVAEVTNQDICEIEYVYRMTDLDEDSDTPDLPTYMHYAIMYGVVWRAAMKDGKSQNLKIASRYKSRFDELATEWFSRNKEYARGQNQMLSQRTVDLGSDLAWRQRVKP